MRIEGLSPSGVHALVDQGHEVLVETNAGLGSYFEDGDYQEAGAKIVDEQSKAWDVDMVIKVGLRNTEENRNTNSLKEED